MKDLHHICSGILLCTLARAQQHFTRVTISAVVILIFLGCTDQVPMVGTWSSKDPPGFVDRLTQRANSLPHYAVGITLDLHGDNFFELYTCGIIAHGQYAIEDDSLVLHSMEIQKRITVDSAVPANLDAYPTYNQPIPFQINKRTLVAHLDNITLVILERHK